MLHFRGMNVRAEAWTSSRFTGPFRGAFALISLFIICLYFSLSGCLHVGSPVRQVCQRVKPFYHLKSWLLGPAHCCHIFLHYLLSLFVYFSLSSSSPLRWSSLLESGIPLAHARMTTRFVLWLPDRCTPTARCERGPYPVFQEIPPAARVQEREVLSIGDEVQPIVGIF